LHQKRKEGGQRSFDPNESEVTEKLGMKDGRWTKTALLCHTASRP